MPLAKLFHMLLVIVTGYDMFCMLQMTVTIWPLSPIEDKLVSDVASQSPYDVFLFPFTVEINPSCDLVGGYVLYYLLHMTVHEQKNTKHSLRWSHTHKPARHVVPCFQTNEWLCSK